MRPLSIRHTALALAIALVQLPAVAAGQAINEERAVSANEKIDIEVQSGEVNIVATSAATFTVKGELDEQAKGFELQSAGGSTRFIVKMPRTTSYWGDNDKTAGSQLEIQVPVGAVLRFTGVNTEVAVKGVAGGARLKTVNGNLTAQELKEDIALETVNGDIISTNNHGRLQLTTVNGSIRDQGSQGRRLNVESVNGEIRLDSRAEEVNFSVVNGEGELTLTGTARLELSSVNGEVAAVLKDSKTPKISGSSVSGSTRLTLDKDISARFELEASAGGSISNSLTNDKAEKAKYGPSSDLNFTTGSGDGEVEISTVSGDIELRSH